MEGEPSTSQNPEEVLRVQTSLFNKYGFLSPPRCFQKFGYNWKISADFSNLHNVPSVDLKVECLDLEPAKFLSMMLIFKNNTHIEQHLFWHVFDKNRCSFCYRRIATGVRTVRSDGVTVVHFPIDRFMRTSEMGEIYDSDVQKGWPIYVPVTWKVLDNGKIETELVKKCYFFFDYSISLKHIVTMNSIPDRFHLPAWPKSNRYPVSLEFFQPLWPDISDFLEEMREEPMTSQECWAICDVLGVMYHQWKFDESRLLQLGAIAYENGMHRFFEGVGLNGDYFRTISSPSSSQIVKEARIQESRRNKSESTEELRHEVSWKLRRIPDSKDVPCVLKAFKDNFQFTINFFKSTFRDEEYLSIGIVLLANENWHWIWNCTIGFEFIFKDTASKILRSTARRRLSNQESSIHIPIVCKISELQLESDCECRCSFHLEHWESAIEDKNNNIEMPGYNDVVLQFQDKSVAVNRTYLGHHCNFFRTMFFNENFEEHKKDVLQIATVSYHEMINFLDALYHGAKIFKISEYYDVLRMADEWICDKVIDVVEKALLNCEVSSVNRWKLAKKFNLTRLSRMLEATTRGVEGPEKKKRRVA